MQQISFITHNYQRDNLNNYNYYYHYFLFSLCYRTPARIKNRCCKTPVGQKQMFRDSCEDMKEMF